MFSETDRLAVSAFILSILRCLQCLWRISQGLEDVYKRQVIHCGCKLIATAHGSCLEDVLDQPFFYKLMGEKVFERYIILDKNAQAGCLKAVLDENGKVCLEQ